MRIWYNKTASKRTVKRAQRADREQNRWQQQALPLGNGMLGITLMGEPYDETVIVNEKTLWTGGPSPKRPDYNGGIIAKDADGRDMKESLCQRKGKAEKRRRRGRRVPKACGRHRRIRKLSMRRQLEHTR